MAASLLMGCAAAPAAGCFYPETQLPDPGAAIRSAGVGDSARSLIEALAAGDEAQVASLLNADPQLARQPLGKRYDMLSFAVASCRRGAVDALLAAGAPVNGGDDGMPLILALRARDTWFAERLLKAGASPEPRGNPTIPMSTVIGLNQPDRVAMLLDAGASPDGPRQRDTAHDTGNRPLHQALDMERFRIAELLLDRGADPWAIDAGGANLATSAATPMLTKDEAEAKAQRRLLARVEALGWPRPAPDPRAIRKLALEGAWPPTGANGAAPIPPHVLDLIRERAQRAPAR
ncbi:hypothetical protein COC42_01870 [Sphingomonas spermidinifaciens]|uniref:Uncharacterized protein n=2 Tax=Sphingomonas spermidinifaciens TaxID=1141889 RepID=A0A2A4B6C2_9SPHN|nr:hypothetical protein COC42_01870 [Sphingomonas spermidinifaciens]